MRTACTSLAAGLMLLVFSAPFEARQDAPAPVVYLAEVDGIIHPVAAEYLRHAIEQADAAGAALLVITLRTPGGLVDSTRDINSAMIAAKTPVAVFVGPAGTRAASAGFLITIAADIAAMAPGTHIGAAHPVAGDGEKIDEVMAKKMASDVAGYARTLATQRKRNVKLVEEAVTESRTYTEQEAIEAKPPLIDLVANDVPDLLKKLDGRTVTRFDGKTAVLHTAGATTHAVTMTWSQRAVLPGVAGGVCLLLAFFALSVLPVSSAGVLLILFGLALLIIEVKVTSYGLLAVGGIVSLLLGSMMLIDSPLPELQIGLKLILPVTLTLAGILLFLVQLAVQSQRTRPVTGDVGMVDEIGTALTPIEPGGIGRVQTHGEIWTATASEPVYQGAAVRVIAVKGLLLTVRPEPALVPPARV
jgi:membrane-bound serine protease (ClpP class)